MPYKINLLIDAAYKARVDSRRVRSAARAALRHQGAADPGALSIAITGDDALRALNRDFLGLDEPTDVLSFPSKDVDPDTQAPYFGDIIISYPQARDQARLGRHPVWAELQLLVVHGVLHLMGHDHNRLVEKERMWAVQAAILKRLKAPITGPALE